MTSCVNFIHKLVNVCYLDDDYVYNRTLEEYVERPRLVLQRFKEEGLKLCVKKCFLGLH
jgi:hypothetical protein